MRPPPTLSFDMPFSLLFHSLLLLYVFPPPPLSCQGEGGEAEVGGTDHDVDITDVDNKWWGR